MCECIHVLTKRALFLSLLAHYTGMNMLASFEEAQKGYEEQVSLLKESLERLALLCFDAHPSYESSHVLVCTREEMCRRELEDLQTRLRREMAERQKSQSQLQAELDKARAEMAWQEQHKTQTEQERAKLAEHVRALEERVKEESSEKQKLEG